MTTQPLFLSVPLLPVFCLTVATSGAPLPLSLLRFSPFLPARFPVPSFPVLRTWLSVRFLSPYPDSLPQLLVRCFPSAFASGLFPVLSASFRLPLSRFRLLSLCAFFSLHPGFPSQWFFPVPIYPPFGFGTQPSVLLFTRSRFASQWLFRAPRPAFRFSRFPLVSRRFRLLSFDRPVIYHFRSDLAYDTTGYPVCQLLFFVFLNYFLAFCDKFLIGEQISLCSVQYPQTKIKSAEKRIRQHELFLFSKHLPGPVVDNQCGSRNDQHQNDNSFNCFFIYIITQFHAKIQAEEHEGNQTDRQFYNVPGNDSPSYV